MQFNIRPTNLILIKSKQNLSLLLLELLLLIQHSYSKPPLLFTWHFCSKILSLFLSSTPSISKMLISAGQAAQLAY